MIKIKRSDDTKQVLHVLNKDGVILLTFPLIDNINFVTHGFSTRLGGVSEGIFSTMNLSYHRGDKKEAVDENYRRLAAALDVDVNKFVLSRQTHTTNIRVIGKEDAGKGVTKPIDYDQIDGLVTNVPGIVLTTFFADCVPIFLIDPIQKAIGLIHSGWRGSVGKIVLHGVEVMKKEYSSDPQTMYAAIGPSICRECYEISDDVKIEVERAFSKQECDSIIYTKGNGKYLLDLWRMNEIVLLQAGILKQNIEITDICTCCNPDLLFSHRASQGKRGNLGAFLSIREPK